MTSLPFLGAARQEMQPRSPHLPVDMSIRERKREAGNDLLFMRSLAVFARNPIPIDEYR